MLAKELDKYLDLVEKRKIHCGVEELKSIAKIEKAFKPIANSLNEFDFPAHEAKILAFPRPYHKYLNAKDCITIFPKDSTNS
jgi:hypothetical protein